MINTNYSNYSSLYNLGSLYNSGYAKSSSQLSGLLGGNNLLSGWGTSSNTIDYAKASFLQNIKSGAGDLQSAVGKLQDRSTYNKSGAVSSNADAMTVSASSGRFSEKSVQIDQVATRQVNEGADLRSAARAQNTGTNRFEIEVDGKRHQFSINVSNSDTNESMQRKMAEAINSSNIGVQASVATDSKNGTSALTVQSKNTGDEARNQFAIRDLSGSAVRQAGVGEVTQQAQNAEYSVDGVRHTSASNRVDLGDGVSATLHMETNEAVTVSQGRDTGAAATAVNDLVNEYNDLLKSAKDNGATRLTEELSGFARSYSSTLNRMGVEVGADGTMTVNQSKLDKAAADGTVERSFTQGSGANYGMANRLSRVAGNVEANPGYYSAGSGQDTASYNNFKVYNQQTTMNILFNQNMGMLFNYMA